jgi:hypothetical protein
MKRSIEVIAVILVSLVMFTVFGMIAVHGIRTSDDPLTIAIAVLLLLEIFVASGIIPYKLFSVESK